MGIVDRSVGLMAAVTTAVIVAVCRGYVAIVAIGVHCCCAVVVKMTDGRRDDALLAGVFIVNRKFLLLLLVLVAKNVTYVETGPTVASRSL